MVTTLRIPTTTKLESWSTKASYDTRMFGENYYRVFERRVGTIRMIRGFRTERLEIDAATASKDNDHITAFDNSKAYAFYDPTSRLPLGKVLNPVPATDEIDWTADDVPCLASGTSTAVAAK